MEGGEARLRSSEPGVVWDKKGLKGNQGTERGSQMVEGLGRQIKGFEWFPHHPTWAIMGLE